MPNDIANLREQLLALMTARPMQDYSVDGAIQCRVGKFLADQADERDRARRKPFGAGTAPS